MELIIPHFEQIHRDFNTFKKEAYFYLLFNIFSILLIM